MKVVVKYSSRADRAIMTAKRMNDRKKVEN
jgi:hypothetical protein